MNLSCLDRTKLAVSPKLQWFGGSKCHLVLSYESFINIHLTFIKKVNNFLKCLPVL